jgi:hypothetical protein
MGQTENTSYFDLMTERAKACETLFIEQEPNQSIFPTHVSSWTLSIPFWRSTAFYYSLKEKI